MAEGDDPAGEAVDFEAALAELDAVTLTGRLDYQACDDEICFNPASIPLTWTITVAPLDRQRALPADGQ